MAQVKALRLNNYCSSMSSLDYHLSELINIAQTPIKILVSYEYIKKSDTEVP